MAGRDPVVRFDYHCHSDYSDGTRLAEMVAMAASCGLDGIGFADHCNVTDPSLKSRDVYSLHETYPERRAELRELRNGFDIEVFDAVELDYVPGEEERLRGFLEAAAFDYSLGSVHHVDDVNVVSDPLVATDRNVQPEHLVDDYFDAVVSLVETELFDVVSHLDVIVRNPRLQGFLEKHHYECVADALKTSRTVPEVNLGGTVRGNSLVHPDPAYLDVFTERDVQFVVGTDAHRPLEIAEGVEYLTDALDGLEIEPVDGPAPFLEKG